ncbi:hypothetical protein R3P38DRAFT_3219220 [Favolaschia claudopus]|uniref:Uncharacterized protein n=1 Tax=Favolaschia claudopus TaxID=2862362 RepID=A0AAW0A2K7_9AGAR
MRLRWRSREGNLTGLTVRLFSSLLHNGGPDRLILSAYQATNVTLASATVAHPPSAPAALLDPPARRASSSCTSISQYIGPTLPVSLGVLDSCLRLRRRFHSPVTGSAYLVTLSACKTSSIAPQPRECRRYLPCSYYGSRTLCRFAPSVPPPRCRFHLPRPSRALYAYIGTTTIFKQVACLLTLILFNSARFFTLHRRYNPYCPFYTLSPFRFTKNEYTIPSTFKNIASSLSLSFAPAASPVPFSALTNLTGITGPPPHLRTPPPAHRRFSGTRVFPPHSAGAPAAGGTAHLASVSRCNNRNTSPPFEGPGSAALPLGKLIVTAIAPSAHVQLRLPSFRPPKTVVALNHLRFYIHRLNTRIIVYVCGQYICIYCRRHHI